MIKRVALLLVLIVCLAASSAARLQHPQVSVPKSGGGAIQRTDSVDLKPSPELKKSLEDLAAAIQSLAHKIASDPQIRATAMHVASSAVTTAQQVVAEQSVALQGKLRTAAERISAAQASQQHTPPKTP
jgi:hypothetical protein